MMVLIFNRFNLKKIKAIMDNVVLLRITESALEIASCSSSRLCGLFLKMVFLRYGKMKKSRIVRSGLRGGN
jgi:hypothetical protein